MSHIENDVVPGSVVDIMQSGDEFHGTETRSEMSRIPGAAFNHIVPDFSAQNPEFLHTEIPDVGRAVDFVEQAIHSSCCLEDPARVPDAGRMRTAAVLP